MPRVGLPVFIGAHQTEDFGARDDRMAGVKDSLGRQADPRPILRVDLHDAGVDRMAFRQQAAGKRYRRTIRRRPIALPGRVVVDRVGIEPAFGDRDLFDQRPRRRPGARRL
jgi:hypothetical protein